jgi:hypothetical protein
MIYTRNALLTINRVFFILLKEIYFYMFSQKNKMKIYALVKSK